MIGIGPLSFAAPWALLGLLALPALWMLLRATPPAPRDVVFAPLRLLRELARTPESPESAPLWLRIARMVLAGLVILALAQPVWRPEPDARTDAPLILVVDDGWAAAARWGAVRTEARSRLQAAALDGRRALLAFTAPAPGERAALTPGDPREAMARLEAHDPRPWAPDRGALAEQLDAALARVGDIDSVWISDGLAGPGEGDGDLAAALSQRGPLRLLTPGRDRQTLALSPIRLEGDGVSVQVLRASPGPESEARIAVVGADGRALAGAVARFEADGRRAEARADLPLELRNRMRMVRIEGERSAGAVQVLDDAWRRPRMGVLTPAGAEDSQPLLSDRHYLTEALEPSAELVRGDLDTLLSLDPAGIVMTDDARSEDERLEAFVEDGGLLLRFAGPRLAARGDALTPAPLREGGRLLGGALNWDEPQALGPFPDRSPFAGLPVPTDAQVERQVLAQPSPDLDRKVWARLADGTPLVTAERRGDGWIVLFHVTAAPNWSNLPLSGLFPQMLERVAALAGEGAAEPAAGDGAWRLDRALDGYGGFTDPPQGADPVPADQWPLAFATAETPPGLYRLGAASRALNVIAPESVLEPLARDLPGATYEMLDGAGERRFGGALLALAGLLFALDAIAALALSGRLPRVARNTAAALLAGGLGLAALPDARAQDLSEDAARALEVRFGYVLTGDAQRDRLSEAGIAGLSREVTARSAIEPAEPVAVDIQRDEILFFSLLYWPVGRDAQALSPETAARVEAYMQSGGLIVFDTYDAEPGPGAHPGLVRVLESVDVPPLARAGEDHVLTRTFYLVDTFPGRVAEAPVWVEADPSGSARDGASSVVIGSADWASAWAVDEEGRPLAPIEGGPRQREMAIRFGVNVAMYALTGNYKADQVHVPAILERLGRN